MSGLQHAECATNGNVGGGGYCFVLAFPSAPPRLFFFGGGGGGEFIAHRGFDKACVTPPGFHPSSLVMAAGLGSFHSL